jgi:hypothetical protein
VARVFDPSPCPSPSRGEGTLLHESLRKVGTLTFRNETNPPLPVRESAGVRSRRVHALNHPQTEPPTGLFASERAARLARAMS